MTKLLDDSEFVIIPFVNPDGYAVSFIVKAERAEILYSIMIICSTHGQETGCGVKTDDQALLVMAWT